MWYMQIDWNYDVWDYVKFICLKMWGKKTNRTKINQNGNYNTIEILAYEYDNGEIKHIISDAYIYTADRQKRSRERELKVMLCLFITLIYERYLYLFIYTNKSQYLVLSTFWSPSTIYLLLGGRKGHAFCTSLKITNTSTYNTEPT